MGSFLIPFNDFLQSNIRPLYPDEQFGSAPIRLQEDSEEEEKSEIKEESEESVYKGSVSKSYVWMLLFWR